jgi:multidrug efflux pump subunit AcrA (membrane-fusion protein)
VRVTFPLGALEQVPGRLVLTRLGGGGRRWTSTRIWEAPADPAFPGHGVFALVEGSDLAQNDHVTGLVPAGAPQDGVTVPEAAVVFGEGASWVYLDKGRGRYLRVPVDTVRRTDGGYFLPAAGGVTAGQPVVVNGAGLLLARELNPSTEPAD